MESWWWSLNCNLLIWQMKLLSYCPSYLRSCGTDEIITDWKGGNITPIFKQGEKGRCRELEASHLASVPNKIMELILVETVLRNMEDKEVIGDRQYGSTKGKLCLWNVVAFCDGVTALVDKGRATDDIYLDLCEAFYSVTPNIFASKLKRHRRTTWCITNWQDGHTQRAAVNGLLSR